MAFGITLLLLLSFFALTRHTENIIDQRDHTVRQLQDTIRQLQDTIRQHRENEDQNDTVTWQQSNTIARLHQQLRTQHGDRYIRLTNTKEVPSH